MNAVFLPYLSEMNGAGPIHSLFISNYFCIPTLFISRKVSISTLFISNKGSIPTFFLISNEWSIPSWSIPTVYLK